MFYTLSGVHVVLNKALNWVHPPTNITEASQWFILKKRKLGVIFLFIKHQAWGGVEGGLAKHQTFYLICFVKPSLKGEIQGWQFEL